MNLKDIAFKVPQERPDYSEASDYVVSCISEIIQASINTKQNRIFIHTNLRRGLPLENINKVAGPFVEAWAIEQFDGIADDVKNPFDLMNVQAGKRLDLFDVILQFKRKTNGVDYVSANVDVKATAEDIKTSGRSPNITSYARIRSAYLEDPDYIFIILSLKHRVFSERDEQTSMTHGIMEVVSHAAYDLKHISDQDMSYNGALGTGQLQIRDIHYVTIQKHTAWEFCQLLDQKFIRSRGEEAWLKMARKFGWIKL